MQDHRAAKRYAQALFTTAEKNDVVGSVEADLEAIVGLIRNDEQFRTFLYSPYVAREEKVKIAEKLFSDRVTALTMYLFRLLLDKRREHELEAIRIEYGNLRRSADSTVQVTISSAEELPSDQQKALVEKAAALTGRKVEARFSIEPHLIGGVKIAYENSVLDGTVRGNLQKLRERLQYDLTKQA